MPELIKNFGQYLALGGKENTFHVLLSHGMTHLWKKENIFLLCLTESVYNRNSKVLAMLCKACTVLNFIPLQGLCDKTLVVGATISVRNCFNLP